MYIYIFQTYSYDTSNSISVVKLMKKLFYKYKTYKALPINISNCLSNLEYASIYEIIFLLKFYLAIIVLFILGNNFFSIHIAARIFFYYNYFI